MPTLSLAGFEDLPFDVTQGLIPPDQVRPSTLCSYFGVPTSPVRMGPTLKGTKTLQISQSLPSVISFQEAIVLRLREEVGLGFGPTRDVQLGLLPTEGLPDNLYDGGTDSVLNVTIATDERNSGGFTWAEVKHMHICFDKLALEHLEDVLVPSEPGPKYSVNYWNQKLHFWRRRLLKQVLQMRDDAPSESQQALLRDLPTALSELVVEVAAEAAGLATQKAVEALSSNRASHFVELPGTIASCVKPESPNKVTHEVTLNLDELHGENPSQDIDFIGVMPSAATGPATIEYAKLLWNAVVPKKSEAGLVQLRRILEVFKEIEDSTGAPVLQGALAFRRRFWAERSQRFFTATVLMFALFVKEAEDPDTEELLMNYGAEPNDRYRLFPAGIQNSICRCPILCVVNSWNKKESAIRLLERRAEVDAVQTLNYFPNGTNLWHACYGAKEEMVDLLLQYDCKVDTQGWFPDTPPLSENLESCSALSLAARNSMRRSVAELLERQADVKTDLDDVFGCAQIDIVKVMAIRTGKSYPKLLLSQSTLQKADSARIATVFAEVASDEEALAAVGQAAAKMPNLLDFVAFVISKSPAGAVTLLDKVLLQVPAVGQQNRNPLPQQGVLHGHEGVNTVYTAEHTWTAKQSAWQKDLMHQETMTQKLFRVLRSSSLMKLLPPKLRPVQEKKVFCSVRVVNFHGLISKTIFLAIDGLSQQDTIDLLDSSVVLQSLVSYVWRTWLRALQTLDFMMKLIYWIVLLIWAQQSESNTTAMVCWSISTASLAFSVDEVLMQSVKFRTCWARVVISASGLALCCRSWGCWSDKQLDDYRSELAAALALSTLGLLHSLRYFHMPGYYLVPILNTTFMPGTLTMMLILANVVLAMFLYALVEFQDIPSTLAAFVKSWQNLVVGEDVLFDTTSFLDPWPRYLVVCSAFFCFLVIMNIFINVTGDGYSQQVAQIKGSFCAERLCLCLDMLTRPSTKQRLFFLIIVVSLGIAGFVCAPLLGDPIDVIPAVIAFLVWLIAVLRKEMLIFSGRYPLYTYICAKRRKMLKLAEDTAESKSNFVPSSLDNKDKFLWICMNRDAMRTESEQGNIQEISTQTLFVVGSSCEQVNGEYRRCGKRNMRPRFIRMNHGDEGFETRLYWLDQPAEWQIFIHGTNSRKSRSPSYWAGSISPFSSHGASWQALSGEQCNLEVLTPDEFTLFNTRSTQATMERINKDLQELKASLASLVIRPHQVVRSRSLGIPFETLSHSGTEPHNPSSHWLGGLLRKAELEGHLSNAIDWAHRHEVVLKDFASGSPDAPGQLQEPDAAEELIKHLSLSAIPAARLRRVVRAVRAATRLAVMASDLDPEIDDV